MKANDRLAGNTHADRWLPHQTYLPINSKNMTLPKIALISLPDGDPLWDYIPTEKLVAAFVKGIKKLGSEKFDYFITMSGYWNDLVLSNQCFFGKAINNELVKAGLKIRVHGQRGGYGRSLCNRIRVEFPDFPDKDIPIGHYSLANGCLYRVLE